MKEVASFRGIIDPTENDSERSACVIYAFLNSHQFAFIYTAIVVHVHASVITFERARSMESPSVGGRRKDRIRQEEGEARPTEREDSPRDVE